LPEEAQGKCAVSAAVHIPGKRVKTNNPSMDMVSCKPGFGIPEFPSEENREVRLKGN
jgi:hypothetical protein